MPTKSLSIESSADAPVRLSVRMNDGEIIQMPGWRFSPTLLADTKPFARSARTRTRRITQGTTGRRRSQRMLSMNLVLS